MSEMHRQETERDQKSEYTNQSMVACDRARN